MLVVSGSGKRLSELEQRSGGEHCKLSPFIYGPKYRGTARYVGTNEDTIRTA